MKWKDLHHTVSIELTYVEAERLQSILYVLLMSDDGDDLPARHLTLAKNLFEALDEYVNT